MQTHSHARAGSADESSPLDGRVALVTGAAGGIGSAIALALARAGARLAVCDLDGAAAAELAARLDEQRSAVGIEMDVTSPHSVAAAVERTQATLGPVEILVNNAGIDKVEPFIASQRETWRRIVEVDLMGPIECSRAVLDGMLARGNGRIVSISSDAGKVGSSGEVVYSGAKGGVIAFSKALAREVAAKGITVNCVCPGPTDTALLGQVAEQSPKLRDALARAVPMKRIGQPQDIAPLVAFLASDGAAYITGQAISVSGGLTMA